MENYVFTIIITENEKCDVAVVESIDAVVLYLLAYVAEPYARMNDQLKDLEAEFKQKKKGFSFTYKNKIINVRLNKVIPIDTIPF